jgi:GNAT superfamily N-acetyltransferase
MRIGHKNPMFEIVRIPQISSVIEHGEIELMELERKCFYPEVQETWESKKKLLQSAISCFFAYTEGRIVGEAYTIDKNSISISNAYNKDDYNFNNLIAMMTDHDAYLCSFGVLPEYNGRGIGRSLISNIIADTIDKGYTIGYTYAHEGVSEHLCNKFHGKIIAEHKNWFGAENTRILYKIG